MTIALHKLEANIRTPSKSATLKQMQLGAEINQ
jgi:hypothetical protein